MSVAVRELETIQRPEIMSFASFPEELELELNKLRSEYVQVVSELTGKLEASEISLLSCPTAADFVEQRKKLYPDYARVSMVVSGLLLSLVNEREHAVLVRRALSSIEKKFESKGPLYLGAEASQEALFSIATLKRAFRWVPYLNSKKAPPEFTKDEREHLEKFANYVLWSQLHLDCLKLAFEREERVAGDVLEAIVAGLRLSLMAYTCVRQALELRGIFADRYKEPVEPTWDNEDESLANS